MKNIKHLTYFLAVHLFVFGLFGCGSDLINPSSKPKQKAWGLAQPKIVKSSGEVLDFTSAEEKLSAYSTADSLEFVDADINRVELEVETQCFRNDQPLPEFGFKEKIQNHYKIFQLLSASLLTTIADAGQSPINCIFKFTATNNHGDTHQFKTRSVQITMDQNENTFQFLSGLPKDKNKKFKLDSIRVQNLSSVILPGNTTEGSKYDLECTSTWGETLHSSTPISMNNFSLINRIEPNSILELPQVQKCSIFEVEKNSKVLNYSQPFLLVKSDSAPAVKVTEVKRPSIAFYSRRFTIRHYDIDNTQDHEIKIELPTGADQLTELTLVAGLPQRPILSGEIFLVPTQILINGAQSITDKTNRIILKPRQHTHLEFYIDLKIPICPNLNIVGMFYGPSSRLGYTMTLFDQLPNEPTHNYKVNDFSLEPKFRNYINITGPPNGFGNLPAPIIIGPTITDLKKGLCHWR